jgi:hypothetical protein
MNKIFGFILVIFAVIQGYLWMFEVISLGSIQSGFYLIMLGVQFVSGLLAAEILYIK